MNVTKNLLDSADFNVIHNYGATDTNDENYIYRNLSANIITERIKTGCYMKTLQGPYNNTGISILNSSKTDVIYEQNIKITIGRIYLWN